MANSLDRRSFLKGAGMTALAGTVGAGGSTVALAAGSKGVDGKYIFDTAVHLVG